jgi:hypothetical protein
MPCPASPTRAHGRCWPRGWRRPRQWPFPAGAGGGGGAPAEPAPVPEPTQEHREAVSVTAGGMAAVGKFLKSKEGRQLQRQVVRGVFGLLKKNL